MLARINPAHEMPFFIPIFYFAVFPSGLAGPAFLGRAVAGRWTAPLLWLRHSDMFAISSFLELFLGDSVGSFLPLNFLAFH